jgi:magnesium chelatase family protein
MVGGGQRLSPGEVTLADHGVLFCDELPEFGRDVLEALRQPLEDGAVAVVRVGRAAVFPARFTFVAAMNPCPCGQYGSLEGACSCPNGVPERYQRRISGPLRDRIDLWVTVDRVPPAALLAPGRPESSREVAKRIAVARDIQRERWGGHPNGRVAGRRLRAACGMDPETVRRAATLADRERMSGRGTDRLLRVARTIADLEGAVAVRPHHLDEAARFRAPADRGILREAG